MVLRPLRVGSERSCRSATDPLRTFGLVALNHLDWLLLHGVRQVEHMFISYEMLQIDLQEVLAWLVILSGNHVPPTFVLWSHGVRS
jgi:hypothetical protein